MPKLKTHKGAAKRVKVTGTGKFMREAQFSGCSHILTKKSPKRIRKFRKQLVVDKTDTPRLKRLLPYAGGK
jgi:large subunit ribosomal protein L35